jgi:hypothetical protein
MNPICIPVDEYRETSTFKYLNACEVNGFPSLTFANKQGINVCIFWHFPPLTGFIMLSLYLFCTRVKCNVQNKLINKTIKIKVILFFS